MKDKRLSYFTAFAPNVMQSGAKRPKNSGGGNSQGVQLKHLLFPTVERRSNDGQSQRRAGFSIPKSWKYAACLLLAFFVGVGNMWAEAGDAETFNTIMVSKGLSNKASNLSGAVLTDNVVYLVSPSDLSFTEEKGIDPNKLGVLFKVKTDCNITLNYKNDNNDRTISVKVFECDANLLAILENAGNTKISQYIFDTYKGTSQKQNENTNLDYWYTRGLIAVSSSKYKADDTNAPKYLANSDSKLNETLYSKLGTFADHSAKKNVTTSNVVELSSGGAYRFQAGKMYAICLQRTSGCYLYSITATPVYQLTWDFDEGTSLATAGTDYTKAGYYAKGTSLTYPATTTMTKSDCSFIGWSSSVTEMPASSLTIKAQWVANSFNVTLHTNGGTINSGSVENYTYGVGATLPTDITYTGYDFIGWYDNEELTGDAVTTIAADATGDKEYWAKWNAAATPYDITFASAHDDTNVPAATNSSNTTLVELSDEDFAFDGWIADVAVKNGAGDGPTIAAGTLIAAGTKVFVTENTAFTAQWTPRWTVSFNTSGGSEVTALKVVDGETVTAPAEVPTRLNYTFLKWQLNGTDYNFDTPVTGNITLDALWSRNAVAPTVSDPIILVGTTPSADKSPLTNVTYNTSYTSGDYTTGGAMFNNATNKGRVDFTIPAGCTATVKLSGKSTNIDDRHLVIVETTAVSGSAKAAVLLYDLTVSSGGSEGTSPSLPAGSYSVGSTSGSIKINSVEVTVLTAPLYVEFMNGETKVESVTFTSGEKLGNLFVSGELPVLDAVTGYTFNGWKDKDNNPVDKNTVVTASMTLYADWVINTHTLTWDFAEGATSATAGDDYTAGGTVAYGTAITYPSVNTMSRSGYDFVGWNQVVASMPDADLTIMAQWTIEKPKHNITYANLKGADNSANPIKYAEETGVASFAALADVEGWHFIGWSPASIAATATTDQTITAQWVPTFTVTYDLNGASGETPTESVKLENDVFTLAAAPSRDYFTFAGWLCSVDNDIKAAETAYTMTAANTTFTAQWLPVNELTDTYIWKTGSGYTGCVENPTGSTVSDHTSVDVTGMDAMTSGRASTAGQEVVVTINVTRAGYGIKSICTYGKLEENAGGEISWDGGNTWTEVAKYSEQKKSFDAPEGTYPTSFKIKFISASTNTGGLWWRNALVSLEAQKTVSGTAEVLVGAKVNGTALTDSEFESLLNTGAFNDVNTYATAPTVTFVKQVTTSYEGLWPDKVEEIDVPVEVNDEFTYWEAAAIINSNTYTVTLAMPTDPILESETTALTLMSATDGTDSKTFKFSGRNLSNDVTIYLASDIPGLTINPTVVSPDANGRITDQEVTVTYASLENVAEANVVLTVSYSNEVKKEIALTYSSTKGYTELVDVTGDFTWDFSKATTSDVAIGNTVKILANYGVNNDPSTIVTDNIEAKGEKFVKNSNVRVNYLHFHTTVPGRLTLEFSNTGGNAARTVYVNGGLYDKAGSANTTKKTNGAALYVPAGDVVLEMQEMSSGDAKNVQLYKMVFTADNLTPDYTRDVTEGRYGTICLPNGGVMTGATLYEVAYYGETSKKIFFDEVVNGQMEAGVPYIFLPEEGASQLGVFYTDVAAATEQSANGLVGFIGSGEDDEMDVPVGAYILSSNQYRKVVVLGTAKIKGYRSYIRLDDINRTEPALVSGRRRISMGVQGEQVATDIDNIFGDDTKAQKVLVNGQMFILRGGKMFDATGRIVK